MISCADGYSIAYRRNFFDHSLSLLDTIEEFLSSKNRRQINATESQLAREEIEIYYSHACVETETGRFKTSLDYFQRGYELCQRLASQSTKELEFALLGGIANSLNGLGRNTESEEKYQECLRIKDPNEEFSIYEVNLCRCQWSGGKLDEASRGLEVFLQRRRGVFGEDDTEDFL